MSTSKVRARTGKSKSNMDIINPAEYKTTEQSAKAELPTTTVVCLLPDKHPNYSSSFQQLSICVILAYETTSKIRLAYFP